MPAGGGSTDSDLRMLRENSGRTVGDSSIEIVQASNPPNKQIGPPVT